MVLALQVPQLRSSIRGIVLDVAGKPVAGARVRGLGRYENVELQVLSDGAGEFEFHDLAGGRLSISVNDENWRSPQLRNPIVEVGKHPTESVSLTVDRQRWIEIDASSLEIGEQVGALLSVSTEVEADRRVQPDFVVALAAKDLSKPVHIPACWGDKFRISLIPMPEEGRQHDGDLGRWIFNARVASATVGFPAGDKPAVTRYVKLKRN